MKRIPILLALAVLAAAGFASADVYLGLQGTFALPLDSLYSSRIGFGVAAGWELSPQFALELGIRNWAVPSANSAEGFSLGKISVMPIELSLRARLPLGPKLHLVGEAGAGYAIHSFTLDEDLVQAWSNVGFDLAETADNGLAAHLGAGLELALSPKMSLDISARYHLMRTSGAWSITDVYSGETATDAIEKLNLDALTVSLGLKIALFNPGESR